MITDDMLVKSAPHRNGLCGLHRIYRLPNGAFLSMVQWPGGTDDADAVLWEGRVLPDDPMAVKLWHGVEEFYTDADANVFIAHVKALASIGPAHTHSAQPADPRALAPPPWPAPQPHRPVR